MQFKNSFWFIIFFFFVVSNYTCIAQDGLQKTLLEDGRIEEGFDSASFPIVENENDWVIIQATINGKSYNFLFDTGTMISLVSPEIIGKEKGLGKISMSDGFGNNKKHKTIKKDVVIGDIIFKDIGFAVADFGQINKNICVKIDGIIGANIIRLGNWKINPKKKILSLSNTPFTPDSNSYSIQIELYAELLPLIEMTFDQQNFWILLDTGYKDYMQINDDFYYDTIKSKSLQMESGRGVKTGTLSGLIKGHMKVTNIDSIYVGKYLFQKIPTVVSSGKPVLGMDFFNDYITVLNFGEKRIYLTPLKKPISRNPKVFDVSFCLGEKKNELTVCYIWNNSMMDREGVEVGDKVIKINGKNTEKMSADSWCEIKKNMENEEQINVVIQKGKKQIEYTLQKNALF